MATVSNIRTQAGGGTFRHTWTPLLQGDDGQTAKFPANADRTVQVLGVFGGATVTFEASLVANTPASAEWFSVTDLQGNAITFTSAGGEFVTENSVHYRPVVTGGDGTTSLTVHMLSRIK